MRRAVEVDLGTEYTLGRFVIYPSPANSSDMFPVFRIDGSRTGEFSGEEISLLPEANWQLGQSPPQQAFWSVSLEPVRYVRLTLMAHQRSGQMQELEIYPLDTSRTTRPPTPTMPRHQVSFCPERYLRTCT